MEHPFGAQPSADREETPVPNTACVDRGVTVRHIALADATDAEASGLVRHSQTATMKGCRGDVLSDLAAWVPASR
jgi:hypothetical protein